MPKGAKTMLFDKDNPCRRDCPDRPHCKGCKRGNAWRDKKNAESKQKDAAFDFNLYLSGTYNRAMKKAEKFKKGDFK